MMSEQADRLEAGRDTPVLVDTKGPPASPSAYHRKLAEVVEGARSKCGELIIEIDGQGNVHKPWLDVVAGALASEGVVDPDMIRRDMKSAREDAAILTKEIERLNRNLGLEKTHLQQVIPERRAALSEVKKLQAALTAKEIVLNLPEVVVALEGIAAIRAEKDKGDA